MPHPTDSRLCNPLALPSLAPFDPSSLDPSLPSGKIQDSLKTWRLTGGETKEPTPFPAWQV
jgi:hypothetical protein